MCVNIELDVVITEFDDDMQSETGSRYSLANISRNSSVSLHFLCPQYDKKNQFECLFSVYAY